MMALIGSFTIKFILLQSNEITRPVKGMQKLSCNLLRLLWSALNFGRAQSDGDRLSYDNDWFGHHSVLVQSYFVC